MTNERAIELLHRLQDEQFDGIHGDERREALSMAVRALEGDGDTIYRQQAIDAVVSAMIDGADAELVEGIMELLPSAQPQACDDAISRKMAIDTLSQMQGIIVAEDGIRKGISLAWQQIKDLPSAHPHRKTGKWIVQDIYQKEMYRVSCSCCGESSMVDQRSIVKAVDIKVYNFCPNCGAKMRGGDAK